MIPQVSPSVVYYEPTYPVTAAIEQPNYPAAAAIEQPNYPISPAIEQPAYPQFPNQPDTIEVGNDLINREIRPQPDAVSDVDDDSVAIEV